MCVALACGVGLRDLPWLLQSSYPACSTRSLLATVDECSGSDAWQDCIHAII